MQSNSLDCEGFHVSIHTPRNCKRYVLFVHGGPGGHSAHFEAALQQFEAYRESELGWVCYDQRGCGRSKNAQGTLGHQQNISDLLRLIDVINEKLNAPLAAALGHSYGARLVFDALNDRKNVMPRLVLVGLGAGARSPRNRSLIMDLIALKMQSPTAYADAISDLSAHTGEPWELAKSVRSKMRDTGMRKFFNWGNLETMRWYEGVSASLPFQDNDSVFRIVREKMYSGESDLGLPQASHLGSRILWIIGFHDFLMGGESAEDDGRRLEVFLGSGHYPHLEEPVKLSRALQSFLRG